MSKPDMEQLEAGVTNLLEAYRRLKDENEMLTLRVEGLTRESESLAKEKEFIKEKLERLSELEAANQANENNRQQVREKVVHLMEKLEEFDLT